MPVERFDMDRTIKSRSIRKSVAKRENRDEVYTDKRNHFEVEPVYELAFKNFWFKKEFKGWVVNSLRVEGWSCAAVGGSTGYVVEDQISPLFSTKFGAYRWLAENVKDWEDIEFYIY